MKMIVGAKCVVTVIRFQQEYRKRYLVLDANHRRKHIKGTKDASTVDRNPLITNQRVSILVMHEQVAGLFTRGAARHSLAVRTVHLTKGHRRSSLSYNGSIEPCLVPCTISAYQNVAGGVVLEV